MKSAIVLGNPSPKFIEELQAQSGVNEVRTLAAGDFVNDRDFFLSDIFQWALAERPLVVTCRESWSGDEQKMMAAMAHLTGRSPESIQYFVFEMGVEVKSQSFTKGLLSFKDFAKAIDFQQLSEQQKLRFQILGELIR